MPVVLAIAASRRSFSCWALKEASALRRLLLRVVDGAFGIGADLVGRALPLAFGNDGLGGVTAGLVLRPLRLVLVLWLLLPDGDVLAARESGAALLRLGVGRADLHELGFVREGLGNVRIDLRLIAAWVGASVLLAEVGKQQLVVSCPVGAVHAASRDGDEMRVPLVERSVFQDEQDVLLNPRLQVADGEKDALGLAVAAGAPVLLKASGQCCFLFVGWQLRQQQSVADADLVAVEGFDRNLDKLGQLQPLRDVGRRFAHLRRDLLDAVLRLFQFSRARKPCASSIG